jgi:hypothetical protein
METLYVVQGFREVEGAVMADKPVLHGMETYARQLGEQLAPEREGVLVYAQSADTDRGEYADPVVLVTYGNVPEPQEQSLIGCR